MPLGSRRWASTSGCSWGLWSPGWLIEHSGYQAMWLAVAGAAVTGAAVSIRVADRF